MSDINYKPYFCMQQGLQSREDGTVLVSTYMERPQVRPQVSDWSRVPQLTEAEPELRRASAMTDMVQRQQCSSMRLQVEEHPCSVPHVTKETFQAQKYKQIKI